ncbi:efflux RND transporter periplasmic adaptor subunit [Actinoallomurus sp. NBC_01490]|uniref:efflux RND transporter periplasmic adaptor subunit n=1 Tax=Actinoallomurus sp. NBC_01490 TaxID=2903557 RepID=UPI002E351132|nr:efflux RND transporter periplasmic adaptor subunit [Actinoallomurus sp. NBC_01490]
MNRSTLRDLRRPPWLAAGAAVALASGLVAVGDAPARAVTQATVLRGDVTATAGAAGTVQSADTRDLVFGTSGTVREIEVASGDKVRAGQVLARLDDTDAREQLEAAKAAVAAADETYGKAQQGICGGGAGGASGGGSQAQQADYPSGSGRQRSGPAGGTKSRPSSRPTRSRTPTPTPTPTRRTPSPTSKPTPTRTSPTPAPTTSRPTGTPTHSSKPTTRPSRNTGGGRRTDAGSGGARGGGKGGGCQVNSVQLAAASVTQAEVKEREAERTLAATKLTAPIDGTILSVGGTVGGQVTGQSRTGFITLGDLDDLQVQAMFPLGEVNQLKLGRSAEISLAMSPGRTYRGTVARIDPAATTDGGRALFGVMISLDDTPPAGLRTGMSATVEVVTAQAESTLYVPAGAVHPKSNGQATVLVRRGGRTTVRTVRTGIRSDRYVAITSGLSAGDHVVVSSGTGSDGFPSPTFPGS